MVESTQSPHVEPARLRGEGPDVSPSLAGAAQPEPSYPFPGMPEDTTPATPAGTREACGTPQTPGTPSEADTGPFAVHFDTHGDGRREAAAREPLEHHTVELLRAGLRLTSSLRVPDALRTLVESACSLTGATWGTIAVEDRSRSTGRPSAPVTAGSATASPEYLRSLLGASASDTEVVIANDLLGASAFTGLIDDEDPGSILSVPLRAHGQIYGRMYLCDKPGGFGPADTTTVLTLAEAAAVAVENSRLYREARNREQWMIVSQELTTMLLSGAEEDDALTLIARRVREVAHANTAVLILPSVGDTWLCEIADGDHGEELIGTVFPPEGRARQTIALQTGMLVPSLHDAHKVRPLHVPALARFGPALYAPMIHRGRGVGVMLLLREQGAPAFSQQDLEIAELVAGQATMAFELADAQHAEEMATLLDERSRIARDLHDLAIQQLFATGMQLSAAQERLRTSLDDGAHDPAWLIASACGALESALTAVDDSVGQIRSIVRSLRDRDEEVSLVERLRREASLARTSLGYAPSLLLSVDGRSLAHVERDVEDELIDAVNAAVDPDVADDMVAVVREGLSNVARHAHASSVTVDIKINGVLPQGCLDACGGAVSEAATGDAEPYTGSPVVEIVCRDDGVGVDPSVTRRSGTANMAERARRHGGSFVIGPRARSDGERRGTCFTWRVPLEEAPGRAVSTHRPGQD